MDYLKFDTMRSLENYQSIVNNFQIGEIIYLMDSEQYLMYNGEEWMPVPNSLNIDSQGLSMTMYELNKSIISQLPVITDFDHAYEVIYNFKKAHKPRGAFMLLCKDISYYTIFQNNSLEHDFSTLGEAVITCAQDIGKVIAVDPTDDGNVEIWVRTPEEEDLCMYLFDCHDLIVTYGG